MGTPVSKSNDSSVTETETEFVSDKPKVKRRQVSETDKILQETSKRLTDIKQKKHGQEGKKNSLDRSKVKDVNVDYDDYNDKDESEKVVQRLKTRKENDLHICNTRFNPDMIQNVRPDNGDKLGTSGSVSVFTKTVAERNTRVNSANFHPYSVTNDTGGENESNKPETTSDQSRPDKTDLDTMEDLGTKEHPYINFSKEFTDNVGESDDQKPKAEPVIFCEPRKDSLIPFAIDRVDHLTIQPDKSEPASPRVKRVSVDDTDDMDPLEGLNIPRNRLYSMGSTSVYSVKEVSNDLYREYMAEIKGSIRSYGFFEAFPTPSLIREAQSIYRNLDIPTPIDDEDNVLPHPSKIKVRDNVPLDTKVLEKIGNKMYQIIRTIADIDHVIDLVHKLIEGLDTRAEKFTILLAWIVHQQMEGNLNDREEICRRLATMCRFAKIKRSIIKGVIHDSSYIPGEKLYKRRGTWLAVLIDSSWLLIDPVIGDGHGEKTINNNKNKDREQDIHSVIKEMLQDPEQFIFSHYPEEEHWQLLARPVAKDELTELPVVRPKFFHLNLNLVNVFKSIITTDQPETLYTLAFPDDVIPKFKCKFSVCDKSMSDTRMRTYVFLETLLNEHTVKLRIRFPKRASYNLTISAATDKTNWGEIITTKYVYEGDTAGEPFPDNPREEWGPGLDTISLGLVPKSFHTGEIQMNKGILQITFHDTNGLQFNHVLFKQDIKTDTSSLKVSFLKDKNNDVVFVVDMEVKVIGTFILQLQARADKRADFENFCTYLIKKDKAVNIPRLEFSDNKLDDNKDVIQAPDSGRMELTVDVTGFIQLTVELKFHDRQELNFSEHALHWIEGDKGYIHLNFPRKGRYTLQVQGRTVVKGQFQTLREEMIIVAVPSKKWSPCPKELGHWNSWYRIQKPLTHHLEEKQDLEFVVDVRNAQDVAVLAANGWYHLERQDNTWTWKGNVWTGPKDTRCRLLARFEIGSEKWSDLLWFKVMCEYAYERMDDRQVLIIENAKREAKKKSQNT